MATSRGVLIASEGDPFTTLFCLKFWKERWENEVNNIYINFNFEYYSKSVQDELLSRLTNQPNIHFIYHPVRIGNGEALAELLRVCRDSHVLLLENDAYIFNSGIVRELFEKIESGEVDVIGSPRRSCTQELYEVEKEKFHIDDSGYGDVGPNFWPNFFFCRKDDLLKTDLNFGSIEYKQGEYSKELDHTFKELNAGDTFVSASIQLRAMGLKFMDVPQHKASPTEIRDKESKEQNWRIYPFNWIHAGSLSSGWGGYLQNKELPELTEMTKLDFETRCAFWHIAATNVEGFNQFRLEYLSGIHELIERARLNRDNIEKKISIYKELMKI